MHYYWEECMQITEYSGKSNSKRFEAAFKCIIIDWTVQGGREKRAKSFNKANDQREKKAQKRFSIELKDSWNNKTKEWKDFFSAAASFLSLSPHEILYEEINRLFESAEFGNGKKTMKVRLFHEKSAFSFNDMHWLVKSLLMSFHVRWVFLNHSIMTLNFDFDRKTTICNFPMSIDLPLIIIITIHMKNVFA